MKVVRVTNEEFELEDGSIHSIPNVVPKIGN